MTVDDLIVSGQYVYTSINDGVIYLFRYITKNSQNFKVEILAQKDLYTKKTIEVEEGAIFWIPISHFDAMEKEGRWMLASESKDFSNQLPEEPKVTNTTPPEESKKAAVSSIFTPFKFWHSLTKQVQIGQVVEIQTNELKDIIVRKIIVKVIGVAGNFVFSQEAFNALNPIFFDDFEYLIPEEKKDESTSGASTSSGT